MEIGARLTRREAAEIRDRLRTITRLTTDRKVREQCRMILSTLGKGERRKTGPQVDNSGPAVEVIFDPFTEELIFKD